jgi:dihydrofolate reductase
MISAIFTMDQTGGIGNAGQRPWQNSWYASQEDWNWIAEETRDHILVMGASSWRSWSHKKYPIKERQLAVFSHNTSINHPANVIILSGDVSSELQKLRNRFFRKKIFVAGGANLLEQVRPYCDEILVARRRGSWKADTRIRISDFFEDFRLHTVRPGQECSFETWRRIITS